MSKKVKPNNPFDDEEQDIESYEAEEDEEDEEIPDDGKYSTIPQANTQVHIHPSICKNI